MEEEEGMKQKSAPAEEETMMVTNDEYCRMVAVAHDCSVREAHLSKTKQEIKTLETEVEKLRLEAKWCFDDHRNRVIKTAEQQALEISRKIMEHPQLMQDVVKALRMKKLDLQSNLSALRQKCDELKGSD